MTGPQVCPPPRPDPPASVSTHSAVMFLSPVAPPRGGSSPARVVFTVGSPPRGSTPPLSSRCRRASGDSQGSGSSSSCSVAWGVGLVIKGWSQTQAVCARVSLPLAPSVCSPSSSGSFPSSSPAGSLSGRPLQAGTFDAPTNPRYSFTDPFAAELGGGVMFEAPELPEETLMEVRGSDTVTNVARFLLTVPCVSAAGAHGHRAQPPLHPGLRPLSGGGGGGARCWRDGDGRLWERHGAAAEPGGRSDQLAEP